MGKKSVEVGVEVGKFAQRRKGLGDALAPPSTLEAPQLVRSKSKSEGQPRRITESAAKTGGDGLLGSVEPKTEIARDAGVGASDRLARLEQRPGSVEECGADQERRTLTEFRFSWDVARALRR